MESCEKIKELLILFAEGALDAEQNRLVGGHLETCAACREEAEAIGKIREWLSDSELFAPDQDYTWQMLPQSLSEKAVATGRARRFLPANFGSLSWALSLASAVVLCFSLVWLTHRHVTQPPLQRAAAAPGNAAFLDRIQIAYAREATAQYLNECEDLLLEVMRAERTCNGDLYDVSTEVMQARQLLQRKRMIEAELKSPQVMQAKALCDELEKFLVDLSTSDRCESHESIRRLERYVEKEKLLLRINVLQSELS